MPRKRWPPSAVLTTEQAARHVGLAASTMAKLRTYGGGPPWVQLGSAVRYRVSDLDAWLEANRTGLAGSLCVDCPHRRRGAG